MSIQVTGLVKQYGEQKAVNQASFEVGKGEIVLAPDREAVHAGRRQGRQFDMR